MLLIHTINANISFIIAIILNPLLIYLILKRSTKELKIYSKILLLTCFVDVSISFSHFISQAYGSSIANYRFVVQNGAIGRWIADEYFGGEEFWPCSVYMFLLFFSPTSLALQFIFRYFVICRRMLMSLSTFLVSLLLLSSWAWVACWMYYELGYPKHSFTGTPDQERLVKELSIFMDEPRTKICIFMDGNSNLWTILNAFEAICSFIIYGIIFFCIYRIHNVSKTYGAKLSNRTRMVDRQMSMILFLQAILPLMILLIPNGVNFLIFVTSTSALNITPYMTLSFPWIPVINPLVTLIFIKSYRQIIKSFYYRLRCCKSAVGDSSKTSSSNERSALHNEKSTRSAILAKF